MNYIDLLTQEEKPILCRIITGRDFKELFKRNEQEFSKIRKGFRAKSLTEQQALSIAIVNVDKPFIAMWVNTRVDIWLKEIQEKMRKIGIASALVLVVLVILGLYGASNYMLNYSLNYPKEERMTAEHWKNRMKNECPWMIGWMDSVYQHHCVKDTFVTMPSGYKAHAIYLYAPKTTEKTAVVVHGYQVRSEGMLHIAYLYNHDMGYNVLLPDLYGHGESEGDHIQMGWKDRWDVIRWSEIANEIFKVKKTRQVIHGISMGAATTMAVSGEKTPDYVKCFVEDCGYTSVWDEFSAQLKEQFGLPALAIISTGNNSPKTQAPKIILFLFIKSALISN